MKKLHILFLLFIGIAATSCERAFMEADEPSNPVNVFDYLWNKVDQQYAFFDVKGVDWDSVREVYRPMVEDDDMDNDSLFKVCAAILNTLRDGHTNLVSKFDVSHNDSVYYKMYAEKNIDIDVVVLNYLTVNYHTTGGFAHNAIRNGEVAYIRYGSFMDAITEDDLSYLLNRYKDCKGLILDLRQNGGGSIDNIRQLLSIFDNHGQALYQTQIKSGPEHDAFTELETVYAADSSLVGEGPYTKPVAVLIDRGSYSATSFFAICTQAYDNVKLFGENIICEDVTCHQVKKRMLLFSKRYHLRQNIYAGIVHSDTIISQIIEQIRQAAADIKQRLPRQIILNNDIF